MNLLKRVTQQNHLVLQDIDGYFTIDKETQNKLEAIGVKVLKGKDVGMPGYGEKYTFVRFFPASADIEKIKEKWDQIASLLPVKEGKIEPSISDASFEFRRRYAPKRTDIEKSALKRKDLLVY